MQAPATGFPATTDPEESPAQALVKVDDELTVEVRAVAPAPALKRSAADVFREVGRWEGETSEELDALFADVRQRSNRPVSGLP